MAETVLRLSYKGTEYPIRDTDISVTRLRQLKQMYGRDYGTYTTLIALMAQAEVDAIAAAIWIGKTVAGEKVKSPNQLDFTMADVEFLPIDRAQDDEEDSEPDPLSEDSDTPIHD